MDGRTEPNPVGSQELSRAIGSDHSAGNAYCRFHDNKYGGSRARSPFWFGQNQPNPATHALGTRHKGLTFPFRFSGRVTYVKHVLAPTLQPGDVVVMDNLSSHKGAAVEALVRAVGAYVIYLPTYSPDLNPIEKCWPKVKAILRKLKARTYPALLDALRDALLSVDADDAYGWFDHAGYVPV